MSRPDSTSSHALLLFQMRYWYFWENSTDSSAFCLSALKTWKIWKRRRWGDRICDEKFREIFKGWKISLFLSPSRNVFFGSSRILRWSLNFEFADEARLLRSTGSVVPHPPEIPIEPCAVLVSVAVVWFADEPPCSLDLLARAVPSPLPLHSNVRRVGPKITGAQFCKENGCCRWRKVLQTLTKRANWITWQHSTCWSNQVRVN